MVVEGKEASGMKIRKHLEMIDEHLILSPALDRDLRVVIIASTDSDVSLRLILANNTRAKAHTHTPSTSPRTHPPQHT